MFRALFARLTGGPKRGQDLFGFAVEEAQQMHWFVEGEVPDTVNGRFAVLATLIALVTVRLAETADGRTRMDLTHEGLKSEQSLTGHRHGWTSTADRLEAWLAANPD